MSSRYDEFIRRHGWMNGYLQVIELARQADVPDGTFVAALVAFADQVKREYEQGIYPSALDDSEFPPQKRINGSAHDKSTSGSEET